MGQSTCEKNARSKQVNDLVVLRNVGCVQPLAAILRFTVWFMVETGHQSLS